MPKRLHTFLGEFFYTLNPILLVVVFVLFSAYINNVIIKFRLAEFDNALTTISNKENTGHTIDMLSRFKLIRERIEKPEETSEKLKKEIKFRSLSQNKLFDQQPVQFTRSDKVAIKVISGIRSLLGKEKININQKHNDTEELEEAYFYEKNRRYDNAKNIYEKILMKKDLPTNLRSTLLLHLGFCKATLGQYAPAQKNLTDIKQVKEFQGSYNWKVAHKLSNEIAELEKEFIKLQLKPEKTKSAQGKQMYLLGNYKQAISILSSEINTAPISVTKKAESYYLLGRANEDLGEESEAVAQYKKIIQAAPKSEWAKKANRRLYVLGKFYTKNEELSKIAAENSKYYGDTSLIKDLEVYEKIVAKSKKMASDTSKSPLASYVKKNIDTLTSTDTSKSDSLSTPESFSALSVTSDSLSQKKRVEHAKKTDPKVKKIMNMLEELRIPQSTDNDEPEEEQLLSVVGERTNEELQKKESIISDPIRTKDVFSVINARSGELKYCFKKWKRKGVIVGGRLTLKINISAAGNIVSAEIIKKDKGVEHDAFETELLNKIKKWKFRPVEAKDPEISITFPVTFLSRDIRNVNK
ncbi:MAG: AgmX/PglI C-terminal domain-containing protein [Fibrobacteria bacterium]|nr:AgmX/PglI C-terminal domain-containing protein [Fibrobacteria bacterium]